MKPSTKRLILRIVHLVSVIPVLGYVYQPIAEAGQYQRSSRMMQKVEAHFVYDRICSRIEAERPQVFLGTIHDALVTTPDQAGYVRRVMIEEFAKVGVTPTIRAK